MLCLLKFFLSAAVLQKLQTEPLSIGSEVRNVDRCIPTVYVDEMFSEFRTAAPIKLGVRLQDVVQSSEELSLALKENSLPFLVGVTNGCVCVCLGPDASVCDKIRATCQAVWLSDKLSCPTSRNPPCAAAEQQSSWEIVFESHKVMEANFKPFLKGVEAAGWDVKRTLLDWDEWRVEWKTKRS